MTSSGQGGTKLQNRVGASGREMRASYARLASEEKGDTPMQLASPF
jgi:hypothetical protein